MQVIKCIILGDYYSGICTLLSTYTNNVPTDISTTRWDVYRTTILIDDQTVILGFESVYRNEEGHAKLRPLFYPQTDVFIIGFSLIKPNSLDSVTAKWIPEIRQHCRDTPVVLVGIKSDLRDDSDTRAKLKKVNIVPIAHEQGVAVAKKICAVKYLECNALKEDEVKRVFEETARTVLRQETVKESKCKKRKCLIL